MVGGVCGSRGHAWWGACVQGRGVWWGIVHDRGQAGGACVGRGVCMAAGRGMCGGGHTWQGVHGMHAPPYTMRYGRSMRGWYASYWNAFLLQI